MMRVDHSHITLTFFLVPVGIHEAIDCMLQSACGHQVNSCLQPSTLHKSMYRATVQQASILLRHEVCELLLVIHSV